MSNENLKTNKPAPSEEAIKMYSQLLAMKALRLHQQKVNKDMIKNSSIRDKHVSGIAK